MTITPALSARQSVRKAFILPILKLESESATAQMASAVGPILEPFDAEKIQVVLLSLRRKTAVFIARLMMFAWFLAMKASRLKTVWWKKRSNAIATCLLNKPCAAGIEKCQFARRKKAARTNAERTHPADLGRTDGAVRATAAFSSVRGGVFRLLRDGIKIVAGKGFDRVFPNVKIVFFSADYEP